MPSQKSGSTANAEQLSYLVDLIAEVPSVRVVNASGDEILTPREEQVVALVAEGMGNREIARELSLSEHTVKKYLFHIFEKLGISTRVELVLYAFNHGNQRSTDCSASSMLQSSTDSHAEAGRGPWASPPCWRPG